METAESMFEAIKAGDLAKVEQIIGSRPELAQARDPAGVSALLVAVYHGKVEVAELLLKDAGELDIFEASAVGNATRVQTLIDADPRRANTYSPDGWTPLHLAAFFGRDEAALALIEKGANLQALSKNDTRNTSLHAAVANRKLNPARMLLAAGADVDAKTGKGWTPLHLAASAGSKEIVELLLTRKPDLSAKNDQGQTALEIALEKGHQAVADLLREKP